jgi:alpha-ribazole phosphatase
MKLYLVRHGETVSNGRHKYLGRSGEPLSNNGLLQAEAVSKALSDKKIDAIFSSSLTRAKQTAEAVAKEQNVKLIVDKALDEINFGKWEGLTYTEIYRDYPDEINLWLKNPEGLDIPGGEKWQDFKDRVTEAVSRIVSSNFSEVCIVSHGGPLRFMVSYFLGLKLPCFIRPSSLMLDHGGLSIVNYEDGFATIEGINDVSHLDGIRKIYRFETEPRKSSAISGE